MILIELTEELPAESDHKEKTLYIEPSFAAAMICPCGCKAILYMPINEKAQPRWDYSEGPNSEATLNPSINRMVGCKSHFWLKRGQIEWCR